MGRSGLELELKFTGAPEQVAALPTSPWLQSLETVPGHAGQWMRLTSRYYDTPDGALQHDRAALRVRDENGVRVQTVKRSTAAAAIVREEYETTLSARAPFPAATGDREMDASLIALRPRLEEIATITVDRWYQRIRFGASIFDIAIDLGHGGNHATKTRFPIAEMKIEFVSGDMADLFALARIIARKTPLRLGIKTKLEIARGEIYTLRKLKKPDMDADAPASDALQAMLAAVAARIIEVQDPLIDLRASAGVHQMRVALRRFRAVERTFRTAIKGQSLYRLTRRARAIAHGLGEARDYDVFLDETLPELLTHDDAPPHGDFDVLRQRAEMTRAAAWARAHALIASEDFALFGIDLLEAGVLAPWRKKLKARGHLPLKAFAPGALDRALLRSQRAEYDMDRTRLAARHPLRIALKKQRYATQMLGPIYEKEQRKPYMQTMSRLQEALGIVNDAVVARQIADECASGAGKAAMRAAGFITGYKTAQAKAGVEEIDRAWAAFENEPQFWHET